MEQNIPWIEQEFGPESAALLQSTLREKKAICSDAHARCEVLKSLVLDGQATDVELEEFRAKIVLCYNCHKDFSLNYGLARSIKLKLPKSVPSTHLVDNIRAQIANVSL